MHAVIGLLLVVNLFLSGISAASAAGISSDPIIRLDTGMHNAPVSDIAIDTANRFLVSGSKEKEVRVWSIPDGTLIRTLRFPIGPGTQGEISAVAISPDGRWIACGGRTYTEANKNYHVYIFDRESGALSSRIGNIPGRIQAIKYSRDGKTLAVGFARNSGIRIFDISTFSPIASLAAFDGSVEALDFDNSGRVVAVSSKGRIVQYDAGLTPLAEASMRLGRAGGVAVSPDGQQIAVGASNDAKVEIFSAKGLRSLVFHDVSGEKGNAGRGSLHVIAWSPDGSVLYAGGRTNIDGMHYVFSWDDRGRGTRKMVPGGRDVITSLAGLSRGGFVAASADPFIYGYGPDGKILFRMMPSGYDFRDHALRLSSDGSALGVFYKESSRFRFSFGEGAFPSNSHRHGQLSGPILAADGLQVTDWKNRKKPKLNGSPLSFDFEDTFHALAVAPQGRSFLLGGTANLCLFDAGGNVLWRKRTSSTVWKLNIAGNGKIAVAGHSDATVRWYRMSDGEEVAALYIGTVGRDVRHAKEAWVVWNPQGYYAASPAGESLVGWHVNNGWDREAYYYSIGRFRDRFYRPDIIASTVSDIEASSAPLIGSVPFSRGSLPPLVRITAPADGAQITADKVPVRFTIESPTGEEITSVKVLINGRPVSQARDIILDQSAVTSFATDSAGQHVSSRKVDVPVQNTASTITVIAMSKSGASEPVSVTVNRKAAPVAVNKSDAYAVKPKLYVLSIGVSKYVRHPEFNLMFAGKDARDFAASMNSQKGKLYRDVTAKVLTDGQATREAIIDGLQWLKRSATQHDVAMIFMSSHGDNSSGQYYFIPSDFDKKRLESTSVLFTYIKDAVASIPGKVLVFMDTCHAGDVLGRRGSKAIPPDINGIVNELTSAENGAIVFTSSTGRQQSLEDEKWNNGAFTRALIDGLAGKADLTGKGRITVNMLDVYLSERVKELTEGRQTPTTAKPQTIQDFPIAVVR